MTVHVIGAGLAGLSAAVSLLNKGRRVVLYEAAAHAGGRCRSFFDNTLGRRIDNGNHLLLSGNTQAMAYVHAIGAQGTLNQPERAAFPFIDLEGGQRWQVRPGRSALPFWLLRKQMRVADSSPLDYLAGLKLAWASQDATVADVLDSSGPLFRKFWEPLCVSALNTVPEEAAAQLLWPVLRQTFGRGEAACRPCTFKQGLSESLIDPALSLLAKHHQEIHFNRRLQGINFSGSRAASLSFAHEEVPLADDDAVILAVSADVAATLMPELATPDQFRAIVNAHFVLPTTGKDDTFMGIVGGVSQWLFVRGAVASVTISAADDVAGKSSEDIAQILWPEVSQALDLGNAPIGPYRIIKEKRATIAQTPAQVRLRPPTRTRQDNLMLAGDWTQTGLPATIEGAITSGHRAAEALL